MVVWIVPIAVFLLCLLAEWLHARRTKRIAYLAFSPAARPRNWVAAAPLMRSVATASVAWGLIVLLNLHGGTWRPELPKENDAAVAHHLVIALDVSPSMHLKDAGRNGRQSRGERARDVLRSVVERLDIRRTRISVIAFYSQARPVVVDTFDGEVVANILDDLPLEHAFAPGKTNMYEAVKSAAKIAKPWKASSATLLLVSDGDTLPAEKHPALPAAFANVRIVGVGNPHQGRWIDEHSSRQDARSLKQLAVRLGGRYVNANVKHVPSDDLPELAVSVPHDRKADAGLREAAMFAVVAGSVLLAFLPIALLLAGTAWNPARLQRTRVIQTEQPLSVGGTK